MGLSTYVVGFVPPDEKFNKMLEIYRNCEAADVPVPEEVLQFFDDRRPDPAGVEVSLCYDERYAGVVKEYHDSGINADGYEVDLRLLPTDIKILRFINVW